MKGDGGLMHRRYGLIFLVLTTLCVLLFYGLREGGDDIPVNAGSSALQMRGRQFRAEVESEFLAMAKADARRTYVLTDVCSKYFPIGMPFSDVEVILLAAGTRPSKPEGMILVPDYNHSLPSDSPDRNDLGSGFVLDKSLVSNSVFEIIFRPQDMSTEPKRVGKIVDCFVRSTSL